MENEQTTGEPMEGEGLDGLDPKTQKYIRELRKENEKHRKSNTEISSKLAALEQSQREKEEKELAESNKHKELYELTKKEKSDLEKQHKEVSEKLKHYEEIYESERQELLAKLPDDLKETFGAADKKQLTVLLGQIAKSDNSAGAKTTSKESLDLNKMTMQEELALMESDPDLYGKLKLKQHGLL